ncbi:MAG TPA: inositol monophosphatase [Firmicutes bacterium]|nr:inositol monophosphatase [Bacillota bacterium]
MIDPAEVLTAIQCCLLETGAMQKEQLGQKGLSVERKKNGVELVTEVDKLSEKMLLQTISKAYPEHDILSEECGPIRHGSDYLWIIDPLDGTTNYAQGIPIFAISVALQYRGTTVMGAVYQPVLGEMFTALKGKGACLNGRELAVSQKAALADCVLATGFPYDKAEHKENNAAYFAHFVPRVRGLRRLGAAAYDLACVAAGRFDGFWEINLSPWDVAAGALLVQEAGGEVIELDKRGVSLVAGNTAVCRMIREGIAAVDACCA